MKLSSTVFPDKSHPGDPLESQEFHSITCFTFQKMCSESLICEGQPPLMSQRDGGGTSLRLKTRTTVFSPKNLELVKVETFNPCLLLLES